MFIYSITAKVLVVLVAISVVVSALILIVVAAICYGPSVISVTVTKGGHPSGGRLYGTSKTMGRGVAKLRG